MRFANLRIGTRLLAVVLAGIIGTIVLAGLDLMGTRDQLVTDRQAKIRNLTESAYSLVDHFAQQVQSGALSVEDAQAAAKKAISDLRYEGDEYFFIMDRNVNVLAHGAAQKLVGTSLAQTKDKMGNLFAKDLVDVAIHKGGGIVEYYWPRAGSDKPVPKFSYALHYEKWDWVIVTGIYVDDIDAIFQQEATHALVVVLILLLAVGSVSWFISRTIRVPLQRILQATVKLSNSDYDITFRHAEDKNEIGDLSRALVVFRDNAMEMDKMRAEQERMQQEMAAERRRAVLELADDFERGVKGIVGNVSASAEEMQHSAESLSAMSDTVSERSTVVAAATEQASSNVQTVAAAAEELTASINEISNQVSQANTITGIAVEAIDESNQKVQSLSDAVVKISEVVDLITDVADQTNLLALNATIEAARAGDAGKGFAVVASEVKNLAGQTARATDEISGQISAVQNATTDAVASIKRINDVIGQLRDATETIAAAVEEQGAATQEISRNVQQAAIGTQEVATNVVEVDASATQAGSSSKQVLDAATGLLSLSGQLRDDVDSFLKRVRADGS